MTKTTHRVHFSKNCRIAGLEELESVDFVAEFTAEAPPDTKPGDPYEPIITITKAWYDMGNGKLIEPDYMSDLLEWFRSDGDIEDHCLEQLHHDQEEPDAGP